MRSSSAIFIFVLALLGLPHASQEVIKEVRVEVPKIVHVPVEVIREVPIEVIKYVDREVSSAA